MQPFIAAVVNDYLAMFYHPQLWRGYAAYLVLQKCYFVREIVLDILATAKLGQEIALRGSHC